MRTELRFRMDKTIFEQALAVASDVISEEEFGERPYEHCYRWFRIVADIDQAERLMPAMKSAGIYFSTAQVYAPGEYEQKMKERERQREAWLAANPPSVETTDERIARLERDGTIVRDCSGCAIFFTNPDAMAPRHKASSLCQSGQRPHCTCDNCF